MPSEARGNSFYDIFRPPEAQRTRLTRFLPRLRLGDVKKRIFLAPRTYAIMRGERKETKAWPASRGGTFQVPCQTRMRRRSIAVEKPQPRFRPQKPSWSLGAFTPSRHNGRTGRQAGSAAVSAAPESQRPHGAAIWFGTGGLSLQFLTCHNGRTGRQYGLGD